MLHRIAKANGTKKVKNPQLLVQTLEFDHFGGVRLIGQVATILIIDIMVR